MTCSSRKCGLSGSVVAIIGIAAAVASSAGFAAGLSDGQDGTQQAQQQKFTLETVLTRDLTHAAGTGESADQRWAKIQSQLGKPAPEFEVGEWQSLNSEMKGGTIESMRGEIVVIDFWGTWCGPCKAAMPHSTELAERYADKQVRVIGICNTNKSESMMETAEKHNGRFAMAADQEDKTKNAYGVQWWPYYVIVDREGVVRAAGVRSDKVSTVVDRLLELQPPKVEEEVQTAPRRRSR
jgi:thiol-disulfide isomerase/thioredoxin